MLSLLLVAALHVAQVCSQAFPPGVIATGTQGTTNPPVPTLPTVIDQSSVARLLSVNSIDDFCIFAPPDLATIPDTETVEVAWCTLPRNNARVIPDGTFSGVSFLKTDFYVQVFGFGDLTKLNVAANDAGGELDPHGASGAGNPVGGNVSTTYINGLDEPIAEWMLFIDYQFFCLRVCTNANSTYDAAHMCWHELDEMGCEFVMPGTYYFDGGVFETCEADVAYPPGWYPEVVDGTTSFSTFAQFFTGVFTGGDGQTTSYTVGDTITPDAPATTPSSSNCVNQATISNGIALASLTPGATGTAPPPGFSSGTAVASPGTGSAPPAVVSNSASPSATGSASASQPLVSGSNSQSFATGATSTSPKSTSTSTTTVTDAGAPSPTTTSGSNAASRVASMDSVLFMFVGALGTLASVAFFH